MRTKLANIAEVLLALWLMGCASFQFYPQTPWGTQCPTAEIQAISIAVHDCCGKTVRFEKRAPKPGESGFVQCRCAETKAAGQVAWLPPRLEPFPAPPVSFNFPPALFLPRSEYAHTSQEHSVSIPPPVPPPLFA